MVRWVVFQSGISGYCVENRLEIRKTRGDVTLVREDGGPGKGRTRHGQNETILKRCNQHIAEKPTPGFCNK